MAGMVISVLVSPTWLLPEESWAQRHQHPIPFLLPLGGAYLSLLYAVRTGPVSRLHLGCSHVLGCQIGRAGGPVWPLHLEDCGST